LSEGMKNAFDELLYSTINFLKGKKKGQGWGVILSFGWLLLFNFFL